jgi:hypothetical protein
MKKRTEAIALVCCVTFLVLSFAACNGGSATTTPGASPEGSATATPSDAPGGGLTATLVADFSNGSPEPNQREIPWKYDGVLDIATLSIALSAATGLDFYVDGKIEGDKALVSWWDTSTLVAGLDDREQNGDFFFYDATSLNWFMMDSLAATVKKNIPEIKEVYYSGENGESVVFPNPEDMAGQGLPVLPTDLPYEGSAFFLAHADVMGDIDDEGRGDLIDDAEDGLAYWNGFDFGPNLSYAEEYEYQSDPGAYMNPAEAAKLTFDDVKNNGYIPGYSDKVEYTMTLVDLAEIDGKECYVYRCDTESGDFSAGFAFPYQSGTIYMQGQGGQWVPLIIGDGDNGEEGSE